MARQKIQGLVLSLFLLFAVSTLVRAQDARQSLGTRSTAAAKFFEEGQVFMRQQKPDAALPLFVKSAAADPQFQLALYWVALAQTDLGDVDKAMETYEKIFALAKATKISNISVDACVNAGLTLSKLKQLKQAAIWYTRAVILDPEDQFQLRWKAFRNMAIGCHETGDLLSAAFCAMIAYSANQEKVDKNFVMELFESVTDQELARILDFGKAMPKIAERSVGDPLEPARLVPKLAGHNIHKFVVDGTGRRLLAFLEKQSKYFIIVPGMEHQVQEIAAPGVINAACLVDSRLFLGIDGTGLVEVNIATGKPIKTWKIVPAPTSLAVAPAQGIAVYLTSERSLQVIDLDTSVVTSTDISAHVVEIDPNQEFCYCFLREPAEASHSGHVIINGRPVYFHSTKVDWQQTSLSKLAIVNRKLIPAEVRLNAASNGHRLYLSPDGNWVGVVGGGGWRPQKKVGKSGYGVALFSTADFGTLHGYFETGAYPKGVATNPVTNHVAVLREHDVKIYHASQPETSLELKRPELEPVPATPAEPMEADPKRKKPKKPAPKVWPTEFRGACAFSPDGRYLFVANKDEVLYWEMKLAPAEQTAGTNWVTSIAKPKPIRTAGAGPAIAGSKEVPGTADPTAPKKLPEFAAFQVSSDRAAIAAALRKTAASANRFLPQEWLQYAPYQTNKELTDTFLEFNKYLATRTDRDAGLWIFRWKQLQAKNPTHPGIEFCWGMTLFVGGQYEQSVEHHLKAIRIDQGLTNISLQSLRCIGQIYKRDSKPLPAAYCYAHVLRLDLDNPKWKQEATEIFELAGFSAAAKDLLATAGTATAPPATARLATPATLAALPVSTDKATYTPAQLFEKWAGSVVLIRAGTSVGSGVCIANGGIIVTNQHVIGKRGDKNFVYMFKNEKGRKQRSPGMEAEVLYESEADDLAILRVKKPLVTWPMAPVPLATEAPSAGAKAFAIGNPGLGATVLEQTISEGIVSAPTRELNGQTFVQHTAAVNPGNSGGALLDEHGCAIGIVTWKTGLERVSFAIPVEKVKKTYEELRQSK